MLNESQQKAVNCTADKILVLAGAGSGKTTAMIARVSRLVDEEKVDVSSILVLTFTNAAACEMRDRYRRLHTSQPAPTFCTFHSYCYSLISKDTDVARSLGYFKGTPRVADDTVIRRIHTKCRQQCGTKLSDEKLRGIGVLSPNEKFQHDVYWKQYNKMLRDENYITFDIMCYGVSKLFSDNKNIVNGEKARYKYIFVDEFQDTDPKQWDFVSSFKNSHIFVVGDAKQSIYGFRGADSSIIKSLAENPEWTTIKLTENYRSTKQICDYANRIHTTWNGNPYNLRIVGSKSGAKVVERASINISSANDLLDITKDSFAGKSVAILCRSNREVAEIKDALNKYGIPYKSNHNDTDISGLLKSAIDSEFCVDWLSNQLKASDYNDFIKYCSIDSENATEERFIMMYGNRLSEEIAKIDSIRKILQSEQFSYGKIVAITELFSIPQSTIKLESDDDAGVIKYIMQLADSLKTETGIYVGTIHSVKGLEYDCVHVIGVNSSSFPIYKHNEEILNLFYVACTRAKENLVIYDADYADITEVYED